MLSFLKNLFGSSGPEAAPSVPTREIEHKGFTVRAEPFQVEGGQYQTAGTVSKEIDGTRREHKFIRADRHGSVDDALDFSLSKGRQIVDEQGERVLG